MNTKQDMKIVRSVFEILLFFSISWSVTQYEHFPTTFDGDSLRNLNQSITNWNEKKIALSGKIIRIENAYIDKPYYQLLLTERNPDSLVIWIGSLIKAGIKVGDEVRILGFVSKLMNDSIASRYNNDGYHVLAYCILNIGNKNAHYLPAAQHECCEWQNGKVSILSPPEKMSPQKDFYQALAKYVGQYPCGKTGKKGLLSDTHVKSELRTILRDDYQDYQNFLAVAGCGKVEMVDSIIISDNSQLHVGGYNSIILIDIPLQKTYLFWMNGTVIDKKANLFGDRPIPPKVKQIVENKMNETWGHVGKFKVSNDSVTVELLKDNKSESK